MHFPAWFRIHSSYKTVILFPIQRKSQGAKEETHCGNQLKRVCMPVIFQDVGLPKVMESGVVLMK